MAGLADLSIYKRWASMWARLTGLSLHGGVVPADSAGCLRHYHQHADPGGRGRQWHAGVGHGDALQALADCYGQGLAMGGGRSILVIAGAGNALVLNAIKATVEVDVTSVQLFVAILNGWPITMAFHDGLFLGAYLPNRRTAALAITILFVANLWATAWLVWSNSLNPFPYSRISIPVRGFFPRVSRPRISGSFYWRGGHSLLCIGAAQFPTPEYHSWCLALAAGKD